MTPTYRFAATLALLFVLQLVLLGLFLLFLSLDAAPEQRALLGQLLAQNAAMLALFAAVLLLALGLGLRKLFAAYLAPLERLAEEAILLAANPRYRATPQGARPVRTLASKLNDLAAAHEALSEQGQALVEDANRSLSAERNRLAALMSDLAFSVLVCNVDGRILLYNQRARELLGDSARVGLGRPVSAVLGGDAVEHALEQVRHQLAADVPEGAGPVAAFVATLAGGQAVRAQMAPVLDDARALKGFVLTVEDITRRIEAEARRDQVLQSLSRDARAALDNIRAAVWEMQDVPGIPPGLHAQLDRVIGEESQRLARDLDKVEELEADAHATRWGLEPMRAADFVALLLRRIDAPPLRALASGDVDPSAWISIDSFALSQALNGIARRLAADAGVEELRLELLRTGRQACLTLSWEGAQLPADVLQVWEQDAVPTGTGGAARTLQEVVAHHGGETVYRCGPVPHASYALLLPIVETRIALDVPRGEGGEQFYDFDLFHQAGQGTELDDRPLSQLACTVFDTETTGLQPGEGDEIIAIGALRILNGRLLHRESFERLVQPGRSPSAESVAIHGIAAAMLEGQPSIGQVLREFQHFAEDTVLVAHNAAFDMRFLQIQEAHTGVTFGQPVLDTLLLSQVIHPNQPQHTLEAIAARLGVDVVGRHTALGDAIVTGAVFIAMLPLLAEKGIVTLRQAREASEQTLYARLRY